MNAQEIKGIYFSFFDQLLPEHAEKAKANYDREWTEGDVPSDHAGAIVSGFDWGDSFDFWQNIRIKLHEKTYNLQLTPQVCKDRAKEVMYDQGGKMPAHAWFEYLKPEHREEAMELENDMGVDGELFESLEDAVYSKNWSNGESEINWHEVHAQLVNGTYHDPESQERMATDEDMAGLGELVGRTISPSTSQYEDMNKKSIYVAGKMRGIQFFNFPAFDKARDQLKAEGWTVVSPADIDREGGFDAMDMPEDSDWDSVDGLEGFDLFESFDRDIAAVRKCDSVYMLKGWQNSTGATAEHACAKWLQKEIIYEDEAICEEAYRIQGGDRQQDYGSPAKNFNEIAGLWNSYISATGSEDLEARDVAHMMILMKISRNVHKPKRDNWVDMAGYAQCGGKVDEL